MKAEFPNTRLQLWPGQFVNVRLLVDTLDQVVVIPTPAVQRGPSGAFAYVLKADDSVTVRPIAVAHQFETQAVIARGISAGDKVVTTGFSRLKEGASVSVAAPDAQPGSPEGPAEPAPAEKARPRTAAIRAACGADIQKHCPGAERGKDMRACLRANAAQLSEACKAATKGFAAPRTESDADGRKGPMRKADAKE
jgi:multidrug efflux system membrane fusion protein